MIEEEVDDFLEHFGIKGQRWGVRNKSKVDDRSDEQKQKDAAQRESNIRVAKSVGAAAAYGVAAVAIDMNRNPQRYVNAAKFAGRVMRKSFKVAAKASEGSKLFFTPSMVVFAPGKGPLPGTFESAQVVRLALGG